MNGGLENLLFWESWYPAKLMIEINDMEDGKFQERHLSICKGKSDWGMKDGELSKTLLSNGTTSGN